MLFCENKYIKFTQNQLDEILNIIINEYTTSRLTIIRIFNLYKLNDNLLYKYLPLIIEQDNKIILKYKAFLISQDFPVDILIKYCDKDMLLYIYNNNKKLSKNNKEKLKNYLKIKEK